MNLCFLVFAGLSTNVLFHELQKCFYFIRKFVSEPVLSFFNLCKIAESVLHQRISFYIKVSILFSSVQNVQQHFCHLCSLVDPGDVSVCVPHLRATTAGRSALTASTHLLLPSIFYFRSTCVPAGRGDRTERRPIFTQVKPQTRTD